MLSTGSTGRQTHSRARPCHTPASTRNSLGSPHHDTYSPSLARVQATKSRHRSAARSASCCRRSTSAGVIALGERQHLVAHPHHGDAPVLQALERVHRADAAPRPGAPSRNPQTSHRHTLRRQSLDHLLARLVEAGAHADLAGRDPAVEPAAYPVDQGVEFGVLGRPCRTSPAVAVQRRAVAEEGVVAGVVGEFGEGAADEEGRGPAEDLVGGAVVLAHLRRAARRP